MHRFPHLLAVAVLLLLVAGPAHPGDVPEDPVSVASDPGDSSGDAAQKPSAGSAHPLPFVPGSPEAEHFDWVRLVSGEWLKGDLERMRDETFEFESDELGDLKIDLDDVDAIYSPRVNTWVLVGRVVAVGRGTLRGDELTIETQDGVQSFERAQLFGMISGRPRERNYWSGKVGIGITARSGNTDQVDLSASTRLQRDDATTRTSFDYGGAFSTLNGEETANNHRVNSRLDWFLTPRLFVSPAIFEFFSDKFQNINYRITPAAGMGYDVFERGSTKWSVSPAAGYQLTKFRSAASGDDTKRTAAIIFATTFETDITKRVEFDFSYKIQVGVPRVSETNHHTEADFSIELFGPIDLDLKFVWDRNEDPEREADGTLPKKNDFRMVVGLAADF